MCISAPLRRPKLLSLRAEWPAIIPAPLNLRVWRRDEKATYWGGGAGDRRGLCRCGLGVLPPGHELPVLFDLQRQAELRLPLGGQIDGVHPPPPPPFSSPRPFYRPPPSQPLLTSSPPH